MARIIDLHKKWMKEPKYRKAYETLEEEFVFASAVIDVRNRAGLTQEELARRMGTTQPVVARLESGRSRPSMRTLSLIHIYSGARTWRVSPQALINSNALSRVGRVIACTMRSGCFLDLGIAK